MRIIKIIKRNEKCDVSDLIDSDLIAPRVKCISMYCCFMQTVSYMAERVVGTGSFGIVFQVIVSLCFYFYCC